MANLFLCAAAVSLPAAEMAATNQAAVAAWPDESLDLWCGFNRHHFTIDGCQAWVVEPKRPLAGNPWSWCLGFPDAFADRCAAPALLEKGFYYAHISVGNTFGSPAALKHCNVFYEALIARRLATKAVLIGLSRGGLYAYRWAAENPEKVAVVYGDAPVCDFKTQSNTLLLEHYPFERRF